MTGLIFLVALGAIGWLALWTVRDPRTPTPYWWPFDMKADDEAPPPEPAPSDVPPWRHGPAGAPRLQRDARRQPTPRPPAAPSARRSLRLPPP